MSVSTKCSRKCKFDLVRYPPHNTLPLLFLFPRILVMHHYASYLAFVRDLPMWCKSPSSMCIGCVCVCVCIPWAQKCVCVCVFAYTCEGRREWWLGNVTRLGCINRSPFPMRSLSGLNKSGLCVCPCTAGQILFLSSSIVKTSWIPPLLLSLCLSPLPPLLSSSLPSILCLLLSLPCCLSLTLSLLLSDLSV